MEKRPAEYDESTSRALALWVVFSRAFASLSRQAAHDIHTHGFSVTEFGVLEYLYHKGPQPMAKIGDAILVSSGNVTYVVDKLVGRGLIVRRPCSEDRRIIYAEITDEGYALMSLIFPKHAACIRTIVSALDPEEQETLRRLLRKLGRAVQNEGS